MALLCIHTHMQPFSNHFVVVNIKRAYRTTDHAIKEIPGHCQHQCGAVQIYVETSEVCLLDTSRCV